MERAQEGDKEAFQVLFAEIGPLITRFVRRRMIDQAEVDDVCQEALIAIFKSRHTYQPSRPFEPWLFAIVRNVAATYLRRSRQQTGWLEPSSDTPEMSAEDGSSLALELQEGFNQLSANQIEALKLTKLAGLSIAEAARRANTTVGSMKVRVHRAYESLKRSMLR
ncbi:MAG TPA: RNA polymerase sigma factor [Candidatus Binataceae bacterium]|nr:RNA polymerase sigma factor [Candidatus Binataceae bacterium]